MKRIITIFALTISLSARAQAAGALSAIFNFISILCYENEKNEHSPGKLEKKKKKPIRKTDEKSLEKKC